jgi:hypothetical protein
VDPQTGDLVIHQEARSANPGVFGVSFSLLNLYPNIQLIAPYFGGQRWGADFAPEKIVNIAWPTFWNAGLIIGETSAGGTFAVWAEDPDMRPKYLRWYHGREVQGLGFEASNDAPFEDKKEAVAFNWSFNTFAGSWMEPAQRFKEWMVKTHHMVPRKERTSKWVDDIALVWPSGVNEDAMKKMAEIMDPKKVLMHNWGWLKGFNRRIPEYIPAANDAAEQAALAHRYGYHVGIYTSMALVDRETFPTIMEDYGLIPYYTGLWRDKPAEPKGWLVYVHPGSAKWREFYSDKMAEVHSKYGVDYFYQDVAGCANGSCGLVEGKTFSAGVVACEAAIRAKVPDAALGGEYWSEVNACQEDFGIGGFLAWGGKEQVQNHADFISRPNQPHPILSFLFSDYCMYWPHAVMIRSTQRFHQDQNIAEVIGAIPVWSTTPDDRVSEARATLERAKLWAEGFRPYFPKDWAPKAASYMRSGNGRIVKYVREGGCSYCLEETAGGDKMRYGRVTGVNTAASYAPTNVDGWIAYSGGRPFGLDPANWYCVFPGQPGDLPIKITALPQGACIKGVRLTDDYGLVEIEGVGKGEVRWEANKDILALSSPAGRNAERIASLKTKLPASLLFEFRDPEAPPLSAALPLDKWQHNFVTSGRVVGPAVVKKSQKFKIANETHDGYQVMPPLGGIGSEYSIDGFIRLPASPNIALKVFTGVRGGIGDGVHFVVRVNGKEIWRSYRETKPGWEDVTIPLRDYAGQDVVLSLAVDCGKGGGNTSCDESIWAEPRITGVFVPKAGRDGRP